ncbi:zinc ribbon domain-containing protein [Deinococcus multiflagellatus]|uniref:zinc ribbon domain-containing protein n=1 Tax=Deinococcus multiflagellatus TaxID=1656887 RepID=UPI001CCB3D39|nr:zinc ribbon domain-containing protein [Deinococcus multiflagellatus]MBZ9714237.1 zinc ribbon domain-containing protein [Deinococcus multiflagellatus]
MTLPAAPPPRTRARYALCPLCGRAVPLAARERYCPNDGRALLRGCPGCGAPLRTPYARFCTGCGAALLDTAPPG